MKTRRLLIILTGLIAGLAPSVLAAPSEVAAPATTQVPLTTMPAPPSTTIAVRPAVDATTTTTTTLPAGDWDCPQWIALAIEAGFTTDELPTVERLLNRESGCRPDAYNPDDPNGGSRGLMQINGVWCDWFLQSLNIVTTCDDLYDPLTNLRAAKAIHDRHGNFNAWGI